jgi:geranylgeranyl diphosphate synthase type II
MENFNNYLKIINEAIARVDLNRQPENLYQPIAYSLEMGGKRLRPILTLAACDLFGGDTTNALNAAVGLEIFHNFTLVHDDIMDDAPLRRGAKTVYKKWNPNIAILSGDTMFAIALQQFTNTSHPKLKEIISVFVQTAIEVCEGQQFDMDFENRSDVSIAEYLEMIRLKTAVLLGASLKIGALLANAGEVQANLLYDFGINAGIAFQLKDDWLDAFGDEAKFGKSIGGDIVANKKTYLYLKCLQMASANDREILQNLFETSQSDENAKVREVLDLFKKYQIKEAATLEMEKFFKKSIQSINQVAAPADKKQVLAGFAEMLYKRDK